MPIPDLTIEGYLPKGIHSARITEVEQVFGTQSPGRMGLMDNLKKVLRHFKAVGIKTVWINGSFVSNKPCGCVDGVWQYDDGVDLGKLERIFLGNEKEMRKKYKVNFVINPDIVEDRRGMDVVEFFQMIKYTKKKKGIVKINLAEEEDF